MKQRNVMLRLTADANALLEQEVLKQSMAQEPSDEEIQRLVDAYCAGDNATVRAMTDQREQRANKSEIIRTLIEEGMAEFTLGRRYILKLDAAMGKGVRRHNTLVGVPPMLEVRLGELAAQVYQQVKSKEYNKHEFTHEQQKRLDAKQSNATEWYRLVYVFGSRNVTLTATEVMYQCFMLGLMVRLGHDVVKMNDAPLPCEPLGSNPTNPTNPTNPLNPANPTNPVNPKRVRKTTTPQGTE